MKEGAAEALVILGESLVEWEKVRMKVWTGANPLTRGMVQPGSKRKQEEEASGSSSSENARELAEHKGLTMNEDAGEDDEVDDRSDDCSKAVVGLVVGEDSERDLDVEDRRNAW